MDKLTPREPSEAERLAQTLADWSTREVRDLDRLDAAAELRRLQAENDALRAMHEAAPKVEAEPVCRADGRCQYAIDSGADGLGHCPKGKCVMPPHTHPAAQQPAALPGLSDAEIGRLVDRMDNTHDSDLLKFARAVIAAMKGKQ